MRSRSKAEHEAHIRALAAMDEAMVIMREAVARARERPAAPKPAPETEPLPSDVIVREPGEEWDGRERWIVANGGLPLPVADGDG